MAQQASVKKSDAITQKSTKKSNNIGITPKTNITHYPTNVYIVDAKRVAIASFLGSLSTLKAFEMQARLIVHILSNMSKRIVGIKNKIHQVIIGNVLQTGQGQGPAKQAALLGGLPSSVVAYTVNMGSGSGMKALQLAYQELLLGQEELIIAGGMENMSLAPHYIPASIMRKGTPLGNVSILDHLLYDGSTDVFNDHHMNVDAENIAKKYKISREEQDIFAYKSQENALNAIHNKDFFKEIVPIKITRGKELVQFDIDESPDKTVTPAGLSTIKPISSIATKTNSTGSQRQRGTVTAGNSASLNDGASAILLGSERAIKTHNLSPMAKIIAFAQMGTSTKTTGVEASAVILRLLQLSGLSSKEIGLFEINETCSAQCLAIIGEVASATGENKQELIRRTNVRGGAIALGNPLGCSGNRIVVTLVHAMTQLQVQYGIAALSVDGRMGLGVLVELYKS